MSLSTPVIGSPTLEERTCEGTNRKKCRSYQHSNSSAEPPRSIAQRFSRLLSPVSASSPSVAIASSTAPKEATAQAFGARVLELAGLLDAAVKIFAGRAVENRAAGTLREAG